MRCMMMSLLSLVFGCSALAAQTLKEAEAKFDHPGCQKYFTYVQVDPEIPGGMMVTMSKEQAHWYWERGVEKYPTVCLSGKKATDLLVWSSKTVTSIVNTLVQHQSDITMTNTETGEVSRGTGTSYSSQPVERRREVVHLFVFSSKDGKLSPMPIARFDHVGRWRWSKPTKDALEEALKFLSSLESPPQDGPN